MRGLAAAAVAVFLACVSIAAQTGQTVFRSGVDLVRFDVRVTDGAGRPIRDLRPEELQVVEDGKVLPLLLFQHIDEPAGVYTDAALRAVSAEVTSNRGAPRGHLYLLVFDQTHISGDNAQLARRAAENFVKSHVRPSDRVAVVGIPGPGPLSGFTADRARVLSELAKVQGELQRTVSTAVGSLSLQESYEIATGNERVLNTVLAREATEAMSDVGGVAGLQTTTRRSSRDAEDAAAARRAMQENARTIVAQADAVSRDFMQRLVDLIEQYRSVEGRKIVVLFSEGFRQQNLSRELERVEAAAADTYSVFYAFDLNRRAAADLTQTEVASADPAGDIQARLEPLGSLAAETDGMLIPDALTRLDASLDRIAKEAQDYYLIGFTPSGAALSARGQYRHVTVRVTRPGAHVRARTGYAAPSATSPLERRGAIDAALAAPFAQQALRVDYTTYLLRSDVPGRARVVLALEAELPVRDANHDAADVVFVVRDARDGRVAASGTDTMPLPPAAAQGSPLGLSRFRVQFELPPGSYLMRAVVREPGGLLGSADRRLDTRSLTGPDVAVSDLILGSVESGVPVRAEAYTEEGLAGTFEIYGRAADQVRTLEVTAALVPMNADRPVHTVRADVGEVVDSRTGVMRRATFEVPLTGVAPGAYTARVKVTSGSETVAELSREVDVAAGAAPAAAPVPPGPPAFRPADILGGDFVRGARARLQQSASPAAGFATRGFHLFADGDYPAAAAELTKAVQADPHDAAVAFVLGWANEAVGNHRDAIGAWRAAAAIDPKMVPAHLALADAYLRLSQPALAAQAIRAGLAALPDSPELRAKLAQVEKLR